MNCPSSLDRVREVGWSEGPWPVVSRGKQDGAGDYGGMGRGSGDRAMV